MDASLLVRNKQASWRVPAVLAARIRDRSTGNRFTEYGDDLFFCVGLPLHLEVLP